MSDAKNAREMLDAWRQQGADRLNPLRFHFIEALARRADGHSGEARRILDGKLAKLLASYGDTIQAAANREVGETAELRSQSCARPGSGPLAELAKGLVKRAQMDGDKPQAGGAMPGFSTYPELALLDYFRDTWSRLGTKRQFKQSLEHVPDNAGPLNSSLLVHRALTLMREVSPEYLHQFLSYVDNLSWVEKATGGDLLPNKDAPRSGTGKKAARGASR